MSIIFFLIPLGLVLVAIAVWAFVWAVNHGQFEDLDKAAHSILYDDDEAPPRPAEPASGSEERRDARETRGGKASRDTETRRKGDQPCDPSERRDANERHDAEA